LSPKTELTMNTPTIDLSQRLFIRPNEIPKLYGISRSTVYRLIDKQEFPKRTKLSARCVGWPKSTLDEYFNLAVSI